MNPAIYVLKKTCVSVPALPSILTRSLSVSSSNYLIQKWRADRGLPMNPNAHGVLTDGPDYSFQNKRPTPYGIGQKRRIEKQRELAAAVIKLTGEIDFAVQRYDQMKKREVEERQKRLDSKLKPKGAALLKKKY